MNVLKVDYSSTFNKLKVICFSNFDVFINNKSVYFTCQKSKEMLAYLVHRRGLWCTITELCEILFGEYCDLSKKEKQVKNILNALKKTLKIINAEDVLIREKNNIAVDINKIDCDYYKFLKSYPKPSVIYTGEYMENYKWAQFSR